MMPEVGTDRLRLTALTLAQLELLLADLPQLARRLDIPLSRAVLTEAIQRAIGVKIAKMRRTLPRIHPWYTYWLVVVTGQHYGAGLIGFKGYPNRRGQVEIGYGIDPGFRNHGYTTEAVRALIAWAFAQPEGVSAVTAETTKSNIASQRVLEKADMAVYQEKEDMLFWQVTKEKYQTVRGTNDK
jgi:RimJ/RimL family protein N-acetyltransferase